jgi:hypothetical protein
VYGPGALGPTPQAPIPNPQSPIPIYYSRYILKLYYKIFYYLISSKKIDIRQNKKFINYGRKHKRGK